MDHGRMLRAAVEELEAIQAAIASVSSQAGNEWKHELIDLRRKLQAQVSEVASAAHASAALGAEPALKLRFQRALSHMRATLALHQANWPAVKIQRADPDYINSVQSVRSANRALIDIAGEIVGRPRPSPILGEQPV